MHRCPLTPAAVCLEGLLWSALEAHGEITLRAAELPGLLGETDFVRRTVTFARDLDPAQWRATLGHELLHLLRGPALVDDVEHEEAEVRRLTAQMLVPTVAALADAGSDWRREDVTRIAARAAVDEDTVAAGLGLPHPPPPEPDEAA